MTDDDGVDPPEVVDDEHGVPTIQVCPSCRELGDKTERVGTRQCKTRECRVHFYQEARPKDVIE